VAGTGEPRRFGTTSTLPHTRIAPIGRRSKTFERIHTARFSRPILGSEGWLIPQLMGLLDPNRRRRRIHLHHRGYDPRQGRPNLLIVGRGGLDGLAITNHDFYRPATVVDRDRCLPGIEVARPAGHLLVIGPDTPRGRRNPADWIPTRPSSQWPRGGRSTACSGPSTRCTIGRPERWFRPDPAESVVLDGTRHA
jgi:hypothetical protein